MKSTTHPVAVKIVQEAIERIPIVKSGTYSKQDPTRFEKGFWSDDTDSVKTYDCTWVVDVTIETPYQKHEILLVRGFGAPDEVRVEDGFYILKYLKALTDLIPEEEDDDEMWMDPAGGIHCGNEVDPAAQYK